MPKRDIAIEIIAPTQGLHREFGESFIGLQQTPYSLNVNAYYGMIQKEYGTMLFATGGTGTGHILAAAPSFIYEAQFASARVVEAFTCTGIYKYSSGTDAFISDGQTASGTFTNFWSCCMHNDELIFVNGVDTAQVKLAYNSTGTNLVGVTTAANAACVAISFANHLNFYNTLENGTNCYKRVRWTKVGALGHTSTDWTGGTAGFADLIDMEGKLMTAERLGNAGVVIYGERSIHVQEWVGGGDVWRFTKMLTNVGTPSRRGVVANDMTHYFLGRDNVYQYSGGRDLKALGDAIKPAYIDDLAQANVDYAFIDYVKDYDEVRVYIPTGTNTYPDICYVYKVKDNCWHRLCQNAFTCAGKVTEAPSGVTIGELLGDIGAQNWKFGDYIVREGATLTVLGEPSGRVVKMDHTVYSISSTGTQVAQLVEYRTKDISSINDIDPMVKNRYNISEYMDNQSRWYMVKLEAKGSGTMYVDYSVDAGDSWHPCNPESTTLTPDWKMYEFELDDASERCMFRFRMTGINEVVHVRYIKTKFIMGSEAGL